MDNLNTNKFEKPRKKSGNKNWDNAKKDATEVVSENVNDVVDTKKEEAVKEDAKRQALEKVKQKAVILDIEDLANMEARKAADAYMTEEKESLKGPKNIIKKIWKHTFFDEYYRQRKVAKVRKEITEENNIYTGRNIDKDAHQEAMDAISSRFISEYDDVLSEGEYKQDINKDDKVVLSINNLIKQYARGDINEEAFKNEKTRILLDDLDPVLNGGNKSHNLYNDNLFVIATNARIAIEHGAKIEELQLDNNIILGKAKSSLKTEAHLNKVDKCIDKMKKSKIGRFVSPAVLNTSVGLAYSLSVLLTKKAAGLTSSVIPLLGSVIASSAFAGMNESQRLALERAQHGVEMAEGGEFKEGSKRREQMEKFGYQMESSNDLAAALRSLVFEKGKDGKEILKDIKPDDLEKIFANLANIEARNSLNAKNKIDLISYSGIGNVEKERTDLTILVAKAKVELRKRLEGNLKGQIPEGKTFDQYLKEQTDAMENSLLGGEKGITSQDKAFKTFKKKEVAKKVLQSATFGFVIGGTLQEVMAFGSDNVQGTFEGIFHHDPNATIQTPLDHIKDWITGNPTHIGMTGAVETVLSNGNHILLPKGTSIIENSDGTFDILRGNTVISDNIHLNFVNGNLDAASMVRLGESGIIGNTVHHVVDGTKELNNTAEDYLKNHNGDTRHIARDGWYDNDTPKPIFDQNELRLEWGGESGNAGIDENGNYVLNVSHMTSGGSFHEQFSVDAQEQMKNGGLKIILSLTEGTQQNVFEVPIDANGNAVIDPNSEIGKLFFGNEHGNAVFKGRFAEVVQSFGDKNGVEHVKTLATLVGEGNNSIHDVVPTHIDTPITNFDIPVGVQPPLFIPIMYRSPLESLKKINSKEYKESLPNKIDVTSNVDSALINNDKSEAAVSIKEKNNIGNDLNMLNKKIQTSKGIITLSKSDFSSDYGKKRYDELKNIPDGKPVVFNLFELQTIGNEMERILVGDRKIESIKITPVKDKKVEEIIINDKKKEDVSGDEDKSKESGPTTKAEKVFSYKDLSKYGTEFETNDFIYKTLSTSKPFFGPRVIMVEGVNKITGEKKFYSYREKSLIKELKSGVIKINKTQEELG